MQVSDLDWGPMADLPFGPTATVPPLPPLQPPPPMGLPMPPPGAPAPPAPTLESPPPAVSGEKVPETLREIVAIAHERNFSDIHIGVGERPRFRERGDLNATDWEITNSDRFRSWVREMLSPTDFDAFLREKEYDGAHDFGFVRVRINLMEALLGPAMVLRLIPQTILTMEQLSLPKVLAELSERPKGMILVTGPTGSGKSTTLAAMIDHINRTMRRHILTIEDPIEFVHKSNLSLIRQREVHLHTLEFANALRAALREDPDVILIGEIRDQVTLSTAIEASQTGHLVFGTLHTNSAVRTIERILGMFKPDEQEQIRRAVSESLLAVVAQGLIKTTDGKRCGYHDLFINTDACRDYIQRGSLDEIEEIMERSAFDGMQTANQALAALVMDGKVAPEDALAQSSKPAELAQALRGRT